MNKARRTKLREASIYINKSLYILENIKDGEESAYDSMPENLQYSSRACDMENNIENLEDAIDYINDAINSMDNVV